MVQEGSPSASDAAAATQVADHPDVKMPNVERASFSIDSAEPPSEKTSRPLTAEERRDLYTFYHEPNKPRPTQTECVDWFMRKYHRRINQSTVSRVIRQHHRLADDEAPSLRRNGRAVYRPPKRTWDSIEQDLFEWVLLAESKGVSPTDAFIAEEARRSLDRMDPASKPAITVPPLDEHWINAFKERFNLRSTRKLYRRSESDAVTADEKPTVRDAVFCANMLKRFVENDSQPTPALDVLQRIDEILDFLHRRAEAIGQQNDTHAAAAAAIEAAAQHESEAIATAAAAAAAQAEAEAASNGGDAK